MSNPGIISTHSAYSLLASSAYSANDVALANKRHENTEQKLAEVTTGKDIEDEAVISKEALTMLESKEPENSSKDEKNYAKNQQKEENEVKADKHFEEKKEAEIKKK